MTAQPPPGDDIAALFEEGRRCFRKPDGLGAVRALEKVIDLDPAYRHPDGDNPYFYLGKIHEVESRYKDAIALYSQALANDPWDEESLIGRGSCLSVTGQQDRAIADFEKVLAIPSKHRRAPGATPSLRHCRKLPPEKRLRRRPALGSAGPGKRAGQLPPPGTGQGNAGPPDG